MDVLRPIFTEGDRLSRAQVDEILRHGPAVAPELVRILADEEVWEAEPPAAWAVVHAAFLLGALRPPGSLDVLAEAVETAVDYDEDLVIEASPFMFAAFGPSALPRLREIARDREASTTLRGCAHEALALLGTPAALDVLRESVDDRRCDQDVRAFAALSLLDFALPGDRARIEAAIDDDVPRREMVESVYRDGPPVWPPYDWLSFYDASAIAERQALGDEDPEDEEEVEAPADAPPPPLRAEAVPGRNDPCPCGSRMKYKKCCGK
jgi:hypothetical protein